MILLCALLWFAKPAVAAPDVWIGNISASDLVVGGNDKGYIGVPVKFHSLDMGMSWCALNVHGPNGYYHYISWDCSIRHHNNRWHTLWWPATDVTPGAEYKLIFEAHATFTGGSDTTKYATIAKLTGGVSSITADSYRRGKVNVKGAWRGNGATGDVKIWYKNASDAWELLGQGLGDFSLTGVPPGNHTFGVYVYRGGAHETQVKTETVRVLGGSSDSFTVEFDKVRVKGHVAGGANSVRLYADDVWTLLGTCSATAEFDCLTRSLPAGKHRVRPYAYRDDSQYVVLPWQDVIIRPIAAWSASHQANTVVKGEKLKIDIDTTRALGATHAQVSVNLEGEPQSAWSNDIELSDGSFEVPGSDAWDYTGTRKMNVRFRIKASNTWSEPTAERQFSVVPAAPQIVSPADGATFPLGSSVSVRLLAPAGVDVVEPAWRRDGGAWTSGRVITLPASASAQEHSITIAESRTWPAGQYELGLRVRKNGGIWSDFSAGKKLIVYRPTISEVFRGSTLTVFDRDGKPLMGGANVRVGDQIVYRLKLLVANPVERIDLSLSLTGTPPLQGQRNSLRYRHDLSDQGDSGAPIDATRLNASWTGAGAAFSAAARLLKDGGQAPSLNAGKYAVIDIPVTVARAGSVGGVNVLAKGSIGGESIAGQHAIVAPDLRAVLTSPQWVWPADRDELLAGQALRIRGRTHPSVDHVKITWRDWRTGAYHHTAEIAIAPDASGNFDVELADARQWVPTQAGQSYQVSFHVSGAGQASPSSGVRHFLVRPGAGVLADSALAVYRGERALGADAGVAAGEMLTVRLRMQASHTVQGLQWSLALPAGLEKAGAPVYRADLSDQSRPPLIGDFVLIGANTLNRSWSGLGGSFMTGTHLLDPDETPLGLMGGKHAVLDIPVRVKAGAQAAIQVKAIGRASLVSQQEFSAPTLLVAKNPVKSSMAAALAPIAKGDKRPGEAVMYKLASILPISVKKLRSIIVGIRCMVAASRFETSSNAAAAAWCISKPTLA